MAELNAAIADLLEDLNARPLSKLPVSRRELFERLDRPALKPLPSVTYRYTEVKKATVHIDHHVEVDAHFYPVPHRLVGTQVEVHASTTTVAVRHRGECVAQHVRSRRAGAHTTVAEHMPRSHRAHMQWTPGRFLNWAGDIGPASTAVVKHLLTRRPHPASRARIPLLSRTVEPGET